MDKIKFYIQAGEGHILDYNGTKLQHHDSPLEIDVDYAQKENSIISFEVPISNGSRVEIGTESLESITITKTADHTFVLGNYSENAIRIMNCCAYNPRCSLTVCGYRAWAQCGDGSQVCC